MSSGPPTRISKRVEKALHQTKVVIRRLPPDWTEEKFLDTVNPLPSHSYYYFAPGDPTLGTHGCCRAYIAFDNEGEILPFRDQYDGLVLESEKGTKYRMTVEFAPFQSIPKKSKRKPDARVGTIEQDADYKAFLEAYETTEESTPSLDLLSYLANLDATKSRDVQSTPLTEYLDKRGARRRGRGANDKKKHKEGGKKGKGSRDESKSAKSSEDGAPKRKDRGRHEKAEPPPRLVTKEKRDDDKSTTQWSVIEPAASAQGVERDSKKHSDSRDRHDKHGRKERGEGRSRNKDRPDRAIYTPRSHDESGRGGSSKSREDGSYHGRSQRYRGGREDGQRDERSSGRPKDRRGRGRYKDKSDFRNDS